MVRFVRGVFYEGRYTSDCEDSFRKMLDVDGNAKLLVDIIDTVGTDQDVFTSMKEHYVRWAHAIMLVYSITSRASFLALPTEFEKIIRIIKEAQKGSKEPIVSPALVVCGNFCDRTEERTVSTEEGRELATMYHASFFETSPKTNTNIDEAFFAVSYEAAYPNQFKV
jgi:GTPase KRas protein